MGVARGGAPRWVGLLLACAFACAAEGGESGGSAGGSTGAAASSEGGALPGSDAGSAGEAPDAPQRMSSGDGGGSDEGGSDGGGSSGGEPDWVYPDPVWITELPEDHGFDPDALTLADDVAAGNDTGCLVVTRHGVIVHEWYADGWGPDTESEVFSVTKSISSTLVGIAQAEGALSVDDLAADYVPAWEGTDSAEVRILDLLKMDSGRYWEFFNDYVALDAVEQDKSAFAVGLSQQHAPGEWWEYNNAAVQTLEPILRDAIGGDVGDYASEKLFARIGMSSSYGYDPAGHAMMYAHVYASCRDLARYGYLYLRGGRWAGGEQVVPWAWVEQSTMQSTDLNSAYGLLWWLNQPGHHVEPSTPLRNEGDGPIVPEAPIGMFGAHGLGAQLIEVDPDSEIVFTRLTPVGVADLFTTSNAEHDFWSAIEAARVD